MVKQTLSLVLITLLIGLALIPLSAAHTVKAGAIYPTAGSVIYAAPDSVGSGDCSNWESACTLREAIKTASSGDEIWVKKGVHYPGLLRTSTFTIRSGLSIYGGFSGKEKNRDDRVWDANFTILSGDIGMDDTDIDGNYIAETPSDIVGGNAYHVVTFDSYTSSATRLDGFVITAGQANGTSDDRNNGGGIFNHDTSNPTLTNIIIIENTADHYGGGMYNYLYSNPSLSNVTFTRNHSAHAGGGIFNHEYSNPTLTHINFDHNSAGNGGGMFNYYGDPILTNVSFNRNSTNRGGGMSNVASNPTLTNVIFIANTAQISGGGGMYNQDSNPFLTNVTFNNNQSYPGGCIYNTDNSDPQIRNVILWGDSGTVDPEIYNEDSASTPLFYNSDIQGCGGDTAWVAACGFNGSGNIDLDPLFVNATSDNLRLQLTSPAIDAGANGFLLPTITTDLDGNPRRMDIPTVSDSGDGTPPIVDMGAYETDCFSTYLPLLMENFP